LDFHLNVLMVEESGIGGLSVRAGCVKQTGEGGKIASVHRLKSTVASGKAALATAFVLRQPGVSGHRDKRA
jgi:hypothetical protein